MIRTLDPHVPNVAKALQCAAVLGFSSIVFEVCSNDVPRNCAETVRKLCGKGIILSYVQDRMREVGGMDLSELQKRRERMRADIVSLVNDTSVSLIKRGFVYFLKMGAYVKIGFSTDVKSRIRNLGVGCPEKAEVIGLIPGTEETERFFHSMFASASSNGEWFRLEGVFKEFVEALPPVKKMPGKIREQGEVPETPPPIDYEAEENFSMTRPKKIKKKTVWRGPKIPKE